MRNLYKELFGVLADHGKEVSDIVAVTIWDEKSRADVKVPIADFLKLARDITYDAGYGGAEIDMSLTIIGEDWWLTRGEYDGAEWFDYHTYPNWEDLPVHHVTKDDIYRG